MWILATDRKKVKKGFKQKFRDFLSKYQIEMLFLICLIGTLLFLGYGDGSLYNVDSESYGYSHDYFDSVNPFVLVVFIIFAFGLLCFGLLFIFKYTEIIKDILAERKNKS